MNEWKSRFYYTWDWVPRLVQIGVWDTITLEIHEGVDILAMKCRATVDPLTWKCSLQIDGQVSGGPENEVHTLLIKDSQIICQAKLPVEKFNNQGVYWQDFPLSSSGVDNWPPEDAKSISELTEIARSYIERRQQHVSLLMWCGCNELQGSLVEQKTGGGKPVDLSHPLIQQLSELVAEHDPHHRFVPTSSSGPRFSAAEEDFGKGLHWDVHGPWKADRDLEKWQEYWEKMDALFNSEVGTPGASPTDIIQHYAGEQSTMPANDQNRLWKRFSWWIEWDIFKMEMEREPQTLEEYVTWSQSRQAEALWIVARNLKEKFPSLGGWKSSQIFPHVSH